MSEVAREEHSWKVVIPQKSVKELIQSMIDSPDSENKWLADRFDWNDLKALKELFSRFEWEKKQILADTQTKLIEQLKNILSYWFEIKNIDDKKILDFTLIKLWFQNFNPDLTKEWQLIKLVNWNIEVYEIGKFKNKQWVEENKYISKYIVDINWTKTDVTEVKTSDIIYSLYNSTDFSGYDSEVENQREDPKISVFRLPELGETERAIKKLVDDSILWVNHKRTPIAQDVKTWDQEEILWPYNPFVDSKESSESEEEEEQDVIEEEQDIVEDAVVESVEQVQSVNDTPTSNETVKSQEYSKDIKALWYLDARPENKKIVLEYFNTEVFDVWLITKIKEFQSNNWLTPDGLAWKWTIGKIKELSQVNAQVGDILQDLTAQDQTPKETNQSVWEVIWEVNSQSMDYFDVLTKAWIDLKKVEWQENVFEVDMKGLWDESPLIVLEDWKFRFQTSKFELKDRDSVFEVWEVIELKEIIDDIDMIYVLRAQNNSLKSSWRNDQFILDKIESNLKQIQLLTQKLTWNLPENEVLTVDWVEHNVENINRVYQELVWLWLDIKKIWDKPWVYELDLPWLFDNSPLIINENWEIDFSTSNFEWYQFSKIPNSKELQKILVNIREYNDLKQNLSQLNSQYDRERSDLIEIEIDHKTQKLDNVAFGLLESPYILQTV